MESVIPIFDAGEDRKEGVVGYVGKDKKTAGKIDTKCILCINARRLRAGSGVMI